MSYTVSKSFSFSASHQLEDLPEGHKCRRLHGHNYVVDVEVCSLTTDSLGMVIDFDLLTAIVKPMIDQFDHRHLNDMLIRQPTSENLASAIHTRVKRDLQKAANRDSGGPAGITVTVHETDKTWARYTA